MNQLRAMVATVSITFAVSLNGVCHADIISFRNSTLITVPDSGIASPYGSSITVSGITEPIQNITVSLFNVSHSYPNDLAAVVVSPTGASVMLFNGPGFNIRASNLDWVFDDNAPAMLPITGALSSGTFRPGLEEFDNVFPSPGPGGKANDNDPAPWSYAFAPLLSQNPNGDWKLYVLDGQSGDRGSIAGGWQVTIQTVPEPSSLAGLGLVVAAVGFRRRR